MPAVSFTDRSRWSGWLEVEKIRAERAVGEKLTSLGLVARSAAAQGAGDMLRPNIFSTLSRAARLLRKKSKSRAARPAPATRDGNPLKQD